MKLFGNHEDLKVEAKLKPLMEEALGQQPAILLAFLQQIFAQIAAQAASGKTPAADGELGLYMKVREASIAFHPFPSPSHASHRLSRACT